MSNQQIQIIILVASLWSAFWKGVALWRSSQGQQRTWFVVLFICLIVNSLGILELLYLFKFAKKRLTMSEIKTWPQMLSRKK